MVGRKEFKFAAGSRRTARQRTKERCSTPLLAAPFVYPPGDAAAVTLTNSDLQRCVGA